MIIKIKMVVVVLRDYIRIAATPAGRDVTLVETRTRAGSVNSVIDLLVRKVVWGCTRTMRIVMNGIKSKLI